MQNKIHPNTFTHHDLQQKLNGIMLQHAGIMQCLKQLRVLCPEAYLAAGVLRNLVWNHLHGLPYVIDHTEIDVIYYAPEQSQQHAIALAQNLSVAFPIIQWDVVNQAHVHHWYLNQAGQSIAAYTSVQDAMSNWPETATAIALRLDAHGQLEWIAPFGIEDLMTLKLRFNTVLVSRQSCLERMHSKAFLQRWPDLEWLSKDID